MVSLGGVVTLFGQFLTEDIRVNVVLVIAGNIWSLSLKARPLPTTQIKAERQKQVLYVICNFSNWTTTPIKILKQTWFCWQLLLELQKEPALLDSAADVTSVLKTLALRLVNEQREGLAVKMHYLAYLTQLARDNGADRVVKKWVRRFKPWYVNRSIPADIVTLMQLLIPIHTR